MIRFGMGVAGAAALAPAAGPVSASMASPAQGMSATSAPVAWVVNESQSFLKGSVTPIDTATNTIVRKITIPLPPLDVVITPDGRTAYVSTDGSGAGRRGDVYPVSTATGKVGKRIPVGVFSAVMAVTPDGKTLYVLSAGEPELGVPQDVVPVNTATNTAGRAINTGLVPIAIAITTGHHQ